MCEDEFKPVIDKVFGTLIEILCIWCCFWCA